MKIKRVVSLKNDLLASIASARKPNYFIRHWIAYITVLAAAGYAAHYYAHNYVDVNIALDERFFSLRKNWVALVVKPSGDIWETFFGKVEESTVQNSGDDLEKGISDFAKDLKDLEVKKDVNKKTSDSLAAYLKVDRKNTQDAMGVLLKKRVAEGKITQELCNDIITAEGNGDVTLFQKFVIDMDKYLYTDLVQSDDVIDAIVVLAELKIYHYGTNLIQLVFELIVDYGIPVVKEVLIVLSKGNKEWAAAYKKVNLILNVAALTPTIIVGWASCSGLHKTYRWATARDYSPIRIALADINALLIESEARIDDHDYGKLVYLICKLRHKAGTLKDPLSHEFLTDVAKLESKQYTPQIKRGIVENMFNKYAFLGRIAV